MLVEGRDGEEWGVLGAAMVEMAGAFWPGRFSGSLRQGSWRSWCCFGESGYEILVDEVGKGGLVLGDGGLLEGWRSGQGGDCFL